MFQDTGLSSAIGSGLQLGLQLEQMRRQADAQRAEAEQRAWQNQRMERLDQANAFRNAFEMDRAANSDAMDLRRFEFQRSQYDDVLQRRRDQEEADRTVLGYLLAEDQGQNQPIPMLGAADGMAAQPAALAPPPREVLSRASDRVRSAFLDKTKYRISSAKDAELRGRQLEQIRASSLPESWKTEAEAALQLGMRLPAVEGRHYKAATGEPSENPMTGALYQQMIRRNFADLLPDVVPMTDGMAGPPVQFDLSQVPANEAQRFIGMASLQQNREATQDAALRRAGQQDERLDLARERNDPVLLGLLEKRKRVEALVRRLESDPDSEVDPDLQRKLTDAQAELNTFDEQVVNRRIQLQSGAPLPPAPPPPPRPNDNATVADRANAIQAQARQRGQSMTEEQAIEAAMKEMDNAR